LDFKNLRVQNFQGFCCLEVDGQSPAEGKKSSSVNMSVLVGHIRVTKNPYLMFFGASAFGSDWFTMDGMTS
jgi:hypothetical protein